MLSASIGLFLICSPLVVVDCFANKRQAFINVISILFFIHILTALVTQTLGFFNYQNILFIHSFYALLSIFIWFKLRTKNKIPFSDFSSSLLVLFGLILILSYFFNLRFNYSGPVRTLVGLKNVVNDFYPYPLYSDEWIGLGFVRSVFETQGLPILNPLNLNETFLNILIVFFSLTAEILILFGPDPVTHYSALSLVVAFGVLILTYLIIRFYGSSRIIAFTGTSLIPLVLNTTNIPGILFYLPFTLSFLALLSALYAKLLNAEKAFILSCLSSFLLYPPICIFIIPLMLTNYIKEFRKIFFVAFLGILTVITIFLLLIYSGFTFDTVLSKVLTLLFQKRLVFFPDFIGPWRMITIPVFLFSIIGFLKLWKVRSYDVLVLVFTGLLFWVIESYTLTFFILDLVRVMSMTSLILIVLAGVGINETYHLLRERVNEDLLDGLILCFFIINLTFLYPNERWKSVNIIAKNKDGRYVRPSNLHINRYFHQDDLKLFKDIKNKVFLGEPWKALIISVMTSNIPIHTKDSTLTVRRYDYFRFMKLSCEEKKAVADDFGINFVYSTPFECEGFSALRRSAEGFVLYKTN